MNGSSVVDGVLVGSGTLPGRRGAVDWIELPSFRLTRRVTVGTTDRGASYAREGMTVFQGNLWFLPEDGPSRVFQFPVPRP